MKKLIALILVMCWISAAGAGSPPIAQTPVSYNTGANLMTGGVVTTNPGNKPIILYSMEGACSTAQYLQIYDSTAVPANGNPPNPPPVFVARVNAIASYSIDFGALGMLFLNGIAWTTSSTGPLQKTTGTNDCFVSIRYMQ
jgi:hypothetical protein